MSDWPVYTPIILAAGASSRMGRPKALLDFDGISGLELVLNACRRQHVGHPIIVLGCAEREIRQLIPPDATIASNPDFMRGQTSSLRLGLSLLPKERDRKTHV